MNSAEITLTDNELVAFLSILGLSTMNSLDEDPLTGMDEREIAVQLIDGQQRLLGQGLLILDAEKKATLSEALVAVVGSAAVPDATCHLIHLLPDGGTETHFFHATPHLLVEQTTSLKGIHQFRQISSPEMLTNRLQALLESLHAHVSKANSLVNTKMSAPVLAHIFEERQKGQPNNLLVQMLHESGLPSKFATEIARDFSVNPAWIGVTIWGLRSVQPAGIRIATAVLGANHCWSIEDIDDDASQVRIIPTTGLACEAKFLTLIDPLLETVQQSPSGIQLA